MGRTFGYGQAEQLTVWSLTLPQAAATLAATLVAHDTMGVVGQRLLDNRMLNVVLVLVLVTAILGPVLTERFAPESRNRNQSCKFIPLTSRARSPACAEL